MSHVRNKANRKIPPMTRELVSQLNSVTVEQERVLNKKGNENKEIRGWKRRMGGRSGRRNEGAKAEEKSSIIIPDHARLCGGCAKTQATNIPFSDSA